MPEITLTINGETVRAEAGDTVLEAALRSGIHIPNLCRSEKLGGCGACGLCVAEAEGEKRLLRTCTTPVREGLVVDSRTPRAENARKMALELMLSDHDGDCVAPCALACPAGTDCRGFIREAARGDLRAAAAIIKKSIPLPATVARICPHPCEAACRRSLADAPLSIAKLQSFVSEGDLRSEKPWRAEKAAPIGKKIAVIGGGCAGLSAAYFLALKGHAVTVFEAESELGGALRHIPALPKDLLDLETAEIAASGVEFKTGARVGKDISFDEIRKSHDALVVCAGALKGFKGEFDAAGRGFDARGFEGLALNSRGFIAAENYMTSLEGVFAAGDARRGAGYAIAAVADASKAAEAADAWLGGEKYSAAKPILSRRTLTAEDFKNTEKTERTEPAGESFTAAEAAAEAARCLDCGCDAHPSCRLINAAGELGVRPGRIKGEKHESGVDLSLGAIARDMGKCILCGQCVRICARDGSGLLGLVGRGFRSAVKPELRDETSAEACRACRLCASVCPTGALRIIGD